jgi:hypothetical protein
MSVAQCAIIGISGLERTKMKRCPECNESFEDKQNFCDMDGTRLVDEAVMLRAALQRATSGTQDTGQRNVANVIWLTIPVGVCLGVVLSLFVYMVELAPQNTEQRRQNKPSAASQQVAPLKSTQVASALPAQTASSPPVEADEAQAQAQQTDAASSPSPASSPVETAARPVNNGPISTGGKQSGKQGPAIIRLKDGADVEADAVWEDKQGVWYRRGGLVSFVDPNRVAAITEPAQPKPSPSDIVRP